MIQQLELLHQNETILKYNIDVTASLSPIFLTGGCVLFLVTVHVIPLYWPKAGVCVKKQRNVCIITAIGKNNTKLFISRNINVDGSLRFTRAQWTGQTHSYHSNEPANIADYLNALLTSLFQKGRHVFFFCIKCFWEVFRHFFLLAWN